MMVTHCTTNRLKTFVNWCDKNDLYLTVSRAKEMCIDFRKNQAYPRPIYVKEEAVERVELVS